MSGRRDLVVGLAVIAIGIVAVVGGTLLGSGEVGGGIDSWPPPCGRSSSGCRSRSACSCSAGPDDARREPPGRPRVAGGRDVRTMIRAVRLAFLAVAAFAAAGAWLVGQELLLVVAAVIAGIDVIETTFLLLVARTHRSDDRSGS